MKKRIICMLLAALMVITILPVEALAVTSIKGAYVGQKFGLVIDVVNNATSYSISGEIPDGLTASGTYTSTNDNYALSLSLTGTPKTAGTYNFRVTLKLEHYCSFYHLFYKIRVVPRYTFAFLLPTYAAVTFFVPT